MADKAKRVDECISTANNLRSTVNKVFQDLANDPGLTSQSTSDNTESTPAANVTQSLKKNLSSVSKVLRSVYVFHTNLH